MAISEGGFDVSPPFSPTVSHSADKDILVNAKSYGAQMAMVGHH